MMFHPAVVLNRRSTDSGQPHFPTLFCNIFTTSDGISRDLLNTNLFGTLAVTQSVLPHFREKKAGIIAFIGSVGGWAGDPGAGPYCGTKFALKGQCLLSPTIQNKLQ